MLGGVFDSATILLIKVVAVLFLVFHLIFSIILLRQTKMMSAVIEAEVSPIIFFISVIHLLTSVFVLLYVLLFL